MRQTDEQSQNPMSSSSRSGNINMSSTIPLITTSEFSYSACQKIFKKQSGLSRHLTIVKKYNIPRNNLDNLSETNNKNFKNILVYLIHCKLPNGFKKGGRQLVSLACTIGYQTLSEILNNPLWGQRFYDEEQ
ncbi:hypothetical protein GLOIN_2v1777094 [Rhizophagus irregularis DAOM 181602=DAOM 197198]|nr:hypothetical protein GLOIN_2v1777094 [Rhizophagus irregularis DAOM 181602=DAOM 197198]